MLSKRLGRWLGVLVVVGCLATAASAPATTVTVTPGGRVTGTAGAVQFVLNTARKTITCSQLSFTATLATSVTGPLPLTIATDLTFVCGGTATLVGGLRLTMACGAATLKVTATTVGGGTPMAIYGIGCRFTISGSTCSVNLNGGVTARWSNTSSRLTVDTSGQTLAATGSTCTSLPNDASVTFSDARAAAVVFAVTPTQTISVT